MERVAQPLVENFREKVRLAGRYDCCEFHTEADWRAGSWTMSGIELKLVEEKRDNWKPELAKFYTGLEGSLVHQNFMGKTCAQEAAAYVLGDVHNILLRELKSQAALSATCRELRLRAGPTRPTIELALVHWRLRILRKILVGWETGETFRMHTLRVYGVDLQQEHPALFEKDIKDMESSEEESLDDDEV